MMGGTHEPIIIGTLELISKNKELEEGEEILFLEIADLRAALTTLRSQAREFAKGMTQYGNWYWMNKGNFQCGFCENSAVYLSSLEHKPDCTFLTAQKFLSGD